MTDDDRGRYLVVCHDCPFEEVYDDSDDDPSVPPWAKDHAEETAEAHHSDLWFEGENHDVEVIPIEAD